MDSTSSPVTDVGAGMSPAGLWDLHGTALFAMACVLLGDEAAALRAVTLGMVDLYRLPEDGPADEHALRSAARCVYRQCQQTSVDDSMCWSMTEPMIMARLGEIARSQRQTLALCLFGGHNYREAATMLDIPAATVARLLNAGLHELAGDPVSALEKQTAQLGEAVSSRVVIDQAKGILMARHDLDGRTALDMMGRWSRNETRTLFDVARELAGYQPTDDERRSSPASYPVRRAATPADSAPVD